MPTSVGVSPEITSSYSQPIASAPEAHDIKAPIWEISLTTKSIGAGQVGQTAVIVPVSILTVESPEPAIAPSVSRIL